MAKKEIISPPEKVIKTVEKTVPNRTRWLTPFKPWQSWNPAGRPKWSRNFETDFLEMLRKSWYTEDDFQKKYIEQLMARPEMMQDVMNRLYGKSKWYDEWTTNIQNTLIIWESDRLNSIYNQMLLWQTSL